MGGEKAGNSTKISLQENTYVFLPVLYNRVFELPPTVYVYIFFLGMTKKSQSLLAEVLPTLSSVAGGGGGGGGRYGG